MARHHLLLVVSLSIALMACGQPTQRESTSNESSSSAEPSASAPAPATAEAEILRTAAVYEAFESEAGALALSRGQGQGVRDFATTIAQDRDASVEGIADAARASHVAAPDATLDEDRQAYLSILRNAQPAQFDATYAGQQALIHMAAIAAFEQFLAGNSDSPLRPWAEETVTRLHERLDAARAIPR